MLRIARILKERAATVIFATTTPVRPENEHNRNDVIKSYNEALVPKLKEMGIVINDLYTPMSENVYKYICEDTIHLSEDGISLAADMVESIIRKEAKRLTGECSEKADVQTGVSLGAPV